MRAHHKAIHVGRLILTGTISSGLTFTHDDGRPYGAPPLASAVTDAIASVRELGFTGAEARAAVTVAASHVEPGASVVELIRAALKALRPASTS